VVSTSLCPSCAATITGLNLACIDGFTVIRYHWMKNSSRKGSLRWSPAD
jgi:hypothetical protein